MKQSILLSLFLVINTSALWAQKINANDKGEVIYHVCQRSFYDSNGDMQGDLNGLRKRLDYLQDLGITSILLLPLYDADCYHNYFANSFEKIDAEFGTMKDYIALVKDIHKHGMKIYLDMETQYVTEKHLWWKDAVGNLSSPYSDYILFDDAAHLKPSTMVFDLHELHGYDGTVIKATTVNLKSEKVLDYNRELFTYFMDPNKDGKFDDGTDGFRLDHAMDNLDNKPALTNLFTEFWSPLISSLKQINPNIKIVGEQAEWKDYGFGYFEKAGVDRMFGFNLQQAILSFDKQQLINKADTTLVLCPKGKDQIIFLENHDIDRFASLEKNPQKQKVAAALMLLMGGIPSIYYGQEIGMQGKNVISGSSDGNSIPVREAFDWYASGAGKGSALWYKNTGDWWDNTNFKSNDGISLEEEIKDSTSLFNFYKKLIHLKQSNPAIANGVYANAANNNRNVFSFYRNFESRKVVVLVNLSNELQTAKLQQEYNHYTTLLGWNTVQHNEVVLSPYEVLVCEIK
ncbi:alpha-amylase family glycosyl hydrolase [Limnovirga soli]|uniref:Alpha-amylase n=1 Tax=Limnovirga soli TaxID=2656915 RepID=A0A8J8JWA4_9BACT|nr:alpha-amylase family glycosyl hydrolase [Limnovirga soli]NNV55086.1 alpha-amylase [Limnovirga soli]